MKFYYKRVNLLTENVSLSGIFWVQVTFIIFRKVPEMLHKELNKTKLPALFVKINISHLYQGAFGLSDHCIYLLMDLDGNWTPSGSISKY